MSQTLNPYSSAVAHHLPHRTRLRIPKSHRNEITIRKVEKAVLSVHGVKSVESRENTGSIIVQHDEKDNILQSIGDAIAKATPEIFEMLVEQEVKQVEDISLLAYLLGAGVSVLNREVARKTNNWFNLKVVLPASLLTAGVAKAVRDEGWLAEMPAWVLIYYAFDTYMKFHPMTPLKLEERMDDGGIHISGRSEHNRLQDES